MGRKTEGTLPPAPLLLGGLFAAYACFAAIWTRLPFKLPRLCPFFLITGRSCPLCGLTRALSLCSRGRLGEAFSRYPMALLSASIGLGALATHLWRRSREEVLWTKEEV